MPSVVQNLTHASPRWGLGLLVSVLVACGADMKPPVAVEDQDALASTEQELAGE